MQQRSVCGPKGTDDDLQANNPQNRDYPLLMALFSMGAFLTLLGILMSDLCYAVVDPRITFD